MMLAGPMGIHIHRPLLDEKSVVQALEAMRTGRPLDDHPLRFFLSVNARSMPPHMLIGDMAVQWAVFEHLTRLILHRLEHLRSLYELQPPELICQKLSIEEDFRHANPELEAWSVLYHRYVCTNYALSMQELAGWVNQDERTLRRRQRLGVMRLTMELITIEQEMRRAERAQCLYLALPSSSTPILVGAESFLDTAEHALTDGDPPHHITLEGPAGIGKSSLALALAQRLIDADRLDDILWINASDLSPSTLDIASELNGHLCLPSSASVSTQPDHLLRAYLATHRVLFVFDSAEILVDNPRQIECLLQLLETSVVILTSRKRVPDHLWLYRIVVPALNRTGAFDLLVYLTKKHISTPGADRPDPLHHFDTIWQASGGNPLLLKLLYNLSRHLPISETRTEDTIDRLFRQTWDQLPEQEQHLCMILLLAPSEGISYAHLQMLTSLDNNTIDTALRNVIALFFVNVYHEADTTRYTLQGALGPFVLRQLRQLGANADDSPPRRRLCRALECQLSLLVENPNPAAAARALDFAEHLQLPASKRWQYAQQLAEQLTQAGFWYTWQRHLSSLVNVQVLTHQKRTIQHLLGIALRWLGHLDEAERLYVDALKEEKPTSTIHADILVELAVVRRYQGRWDQALNLLREAMSIYDQHNVTTGNERCALEFSQIALDFQRPDEALAWLNTLDEWSLRAWNIASQAYFEAERFGEALDAAKHALAAQFVDHPNRGRALATLGQIHDALDQHEIAINYLSLAVEQLDRTRDIIGYARACNNLAVAYLKQLPQGQSTTTSYIMQLLVRAERIQQHTGDEIGLAVTQQNLNWFQSKE